MGTQNHRTNNNEGDAFALVYGHEAVIPSEIGVPTSWVINYPDANDQNSRLEELDNLEERREIVTVKQTTYNQTIARYHDTKVKPKTLKVRDLVLRAVENNRVNLRHGKLNPNYKGPYRENKGSGEQLPLE